MKEESRRNLAAGLLILLGAVLFVLQFFLASAQGLLLLGTGGLLLASWAMRRTQAHLVMGSILAALGAHQLMHAQWPGMEDTIGLCLGFGFILMYLLDRLTDERASWWPLLPGFVLVVRAAENNFSWMEGALHRGWPLLLILVGVWMLRRRKQTASEEQESA